MTTKDNSFAAVMARKAEIIRAAVGVDYKQFESGSIAFDYEKMMASTSYTLEDVREIQRGFSIGNTPLIELKNITALVRKLSKSGYGARIFVKDEAANPSGSFKVRRAATSIHHAKKMGYPGALSATSGNYGAAVASCCAKSGLPSIVVQECYDSRGVGQPEIIEKARKCEALGAEVVQLTVGPELFYTVLRMLEDTGYFNASLYTAFGIAGIETLGYEVAEQCRAQTGKDPDVVVCTNAGGGNLTGTARGLLKANCTPQIVAASVNLKGLHMASDTQFNKKSFTTGHTGFGMPFSTWPDRSNVPRSAARPLRYMDRYVTVSQGEVFYTTELLARLEGIERGPAGNTSLAAAISIAQELPEDGIVVVQETEYTGAGKHGSAQLSFARQNGIKVSLGDPIDEIAGESIVLPAHPSLLKAMDVDVDHMRRSLITHAATSIDHAPSQADIAFLAEETKSSAVFVLDTLKQP